MTCRILLRFTFRNHLNELRQHKDEFLHIADFNNYLHRQPGKAKALGYKGSVIPDYPDMDRTTEVRLSIYFHDGVNEEEIPFKDYDDMIRHLEKYPEMARALQL